MTPTATSRVNNRAAEIYRSLQDRTFRDTDRMFAVLMAVQWVFGIVAAIWVSPWAWEGSAVAIHPHVLGAVFLGGAISVPAIVAAVKWPGRTITRHIIAVSQMLTSALLIHLTGGRIETHFHVFGSLAFLAFYRDERVLIPATLVVALDHLLRGMFWPQSVYGVVSATPWRTLEHASWVIFEDIVLVFYCLRGQRELWQFACGTADVEVSQERYRATVEQSGESIVVFDAATQNILEANQRFAELTGAPAGPLLELVIDKSMIGGPADLSFQDEVESIIRDDRPAVSERTLRRFDGGTVEVSCTLSPTTFGGRPAICGVIHDITHLKKIEQDLARARDAAIESARLKSEFLANMSHEIRTPMNGIVGMAGLILETSLNTDQREFANTIQASADSLLVIINDILDFSKVEAGKLEFDEIDFDLRRELEGALDLMAARAFGKGLELALLVEPDVPTALRGDPGRLRQVVLNLIGNAVKFTHEGEVVVQVSSVPKPFDGVRLRFEIRDTGIGIPPETQERLFEAFVQADGSTTRKYGGTGLGLAISRRLVELMHGGIGVNSRAGIGSTFWFEAEFIAQPEGAAIEPAAGDLSGRRVLVVDDNETNRRVLHHQLASWGAIDTGVADVPSGLSALRIAQTLHKQFDLIVLDRQMPDQDGVMLARTVSQDPELSKVPMVMMTSLGHPSDREELRSLGIVACLSKPVKASSVRDALIRALRGDGRTKSPVATTVAAKAPTLHGRILVAEDNVINQRVALHQLRSLGCTADAVGNGAEAVAALKTIPYDIVLMDCQMPEVDGFEATGRIRALSSSVRRIPIIAMTASAVSGDRERCLEAGMDDYLSKPVHRGDLENVLRRWLSREVEAADPVAQ